MLLLISYDLQDMHERYNAFCSRVRELGTPNFCTRSVVLLQTLTTAGDVDSELKKIIDKSDSLLVLDITGISEDRYFGRCHKTVNGIGVWNWIRANNH